MSTRLRSGFAQSTLLATALFGSLGACGSSPDGATEDVAQARSAFIHIQSCGLGFRQSCCITAAQTSFPGCYCCAATNPVTQTLTPTPSFQVVGIDYTVLGNMSEVDYTKGSYTGSHTDFQTVRSIGVDAHFGLQDIFDIENKFTFGTISGGGHGSQITSTTGIQVTTNMTDDAAHHEKDIFSIWVNPIVHVTSASPSKTITGISVDSDGPPIVETLTAGELTGAQPIPGFMKLSALTAADKQRILAMDPFFMPGGFNPASTRFEYKKSLDLDGPMNPGDNFVANTFDLQSDMSTDSSAGLQVADELVADYSFVPEVLSAGIDLQYQYQSITTATIGTTAVASLKLGTSNRGVHVGVDVYKDKAFNTFIVVPKATDGNGAASAWDTCGSPHSLCETGGPLDSKCPADACIQTVCAEDSFCCSTSWDGTCVNEATACGTNSCLQSVCSGDPFCCSTSWDGTCVNEASACAPAVCGSH